MSAWIDIPEPVYGWFAMKCPCCWRRFWRWSPYHDHYLMRHLGDADALEKRGGNVGESGLYQRVANSPDA
jgi:hypothetical protein